MTTTINASTSSGLVNTADTSGILQLQTAGTAALTVDASQNVGIGTTTPTGALLHVSSSTDTTYRQTKTGQSDWATQTLDSGVWRLYSYTASAERMRIDSSGNVMVNTTSNSGQLTSSCNSSTQNPLALIDTGTTYSTGNYYIRFVNSAGNTAGSVQHTAVTTVAYATTSDERLKENIVDAPSALDKINSVKVRSFDWKEDNKHTDYGFIAQELYEIYPDAVGKGDDTPTIEDEKGTWQVEYGRLTPLLFKAIQEQQVIITELKSRIEALEGAK
jgi:hypothetical protein